MADQQETIVIDDREMFQSAMEDAPQEQIPEQPRDEQGRFAPKTDEATSAEPVKEVLEVKPEPAAATTEPTEQPKDDTANVPSWRLREVSEERKALAKERDEANRERYELQSQLQAMSQRLQKFEAPKAEPVDFFADPDQALQQRLSPFEQRFAKLEQDTRLSLSRSAAIAAHGMPAVKEMETAIEKAMRENHPDVQTLAAQLRASDDPASVAMNWYRHQKVVTETGGDLTAYKERIRQEALKDPAYLAQAMEAARGQAGNPSPGSRPNIQLPPSLNKAAGSGSNSSTADDGDMSDRSLFRAAMAPARSR